MADHKKVPGCALCESEVCCPEHCCDWDDCQCRDCPECLPLKEREARNHVGNDQISNKIEQIDEFQFKGSDGLHVIHHYQNQNEKEKPEFKGISLHEVDSETKTTNTMSTKSTTVESNSATEEEEEDQHLEEVKFEVNINPVPPVGKKRAVGGGLAGIRFLRTQESRDS